MLDAHPDVAVPDEVAFIVRYSRPHYAVHYGWPMRFDAGRCADMILADGSFRRWVSGGVIDAAEGRRALTDPPPGSFADAIRHLYAAAAARRAKPRYADKTPVHVQHMRRLARLFPESRFVHLVRDGRDVAASYREVRWGPSTIEEAALRWQTSVRRGRRSGRRLGPRRYHEVRYENLVAEPERVLRDVSTFLDLRWDDAVLHHHEQAAEVVARTRFPDAHRHVLLPPTPGLRDWRRELTAIEVRRFEAVAGGLLDELGYGRAEPPPPLRLRASAAWSAITIRSHRIAVQSRAGARVLARGPRTVGR
jgi:hypothetical protein